MKLSSKIIIVAFLIISLSASAIPSFAKITVQSSCYNSHSSLSESIAIENAMYSDYTSILPDKIKSKGSGTGFGDADGEFSHTISTDNGEGRSLIAYSVETDSATFSWSKSASLEREVDDKSLSGKYDLDDGTVSVSLHNDEAEISEDLNIVGSKYSGVGGVSSDSMAVMGRGISNKDSESDLLYHSLDVNSGDKVTHITVDQSGKSIKYLWKDVAKITPNEKSLGLVLKTYANDGETETRMVGTATEFPTQVLPAGNLLIENEPIVVNVPVDVPHDHLEVDDLLDIDIDDLLNIDMPLNPSDMMEDVVLSDKPVDDSDDGSSGDDDPSDEDQITPREYPYLEGRGNFNFLMRMKFNVPS